MIKSILKWGFVLILFIAIIAVATINVFSYKLNAPDHILENYFESLGTPATIKRINFEGKTLRYVESGLQEDWAPIIFFIHGAPGTLDAFKEFLADYDLNHKARLIAMDRLGYGGSDFGNPETSIVTHAQTAELILDRYESSNTIIVSHSYGSPVSAALAARRPELVDGLLMISPVNDPISEPVEWYAYLANLKVFRWLLPGFVDVATTEKMSHKTALMEIVPLFSEITCPVVHYHGTNDELAPYNGNIEFSKNNIDPLNLRIIEEESGGHLLIWSRGATIKNMIFDLLNQISD